METTQEAIGNTVTAPDEIRDYTAWQRAFALRRLWERATATRGAGCPIVAELVAGGHWKTLDALCREVWPDD